jgi:hypothetical protein
MGGIPPTLGNYSHPNIVNLSMNFLLGLILSKLGELTSPIIMDLSYCAFTCKIPSILSRLPLENLDVSCNNLSGVFPPGLLAVTNAKNNLDLCDMARNYEPNGQQTNNKSNGVMVSAMVGTIVAAMIIFIVGSCYFYQRYKNFNEQHKGLL